MDSNNLSRIRSIFQNRDNRFTAVIIGLLLGFSALLSGLEIIRRAIWNMFRLENEQISNAEQFRAVNVIGNCAFFVS